MENLPDMIQGRYGHGSVGLGNKLFFIAGLRTGSFEEFDSNSNVFTEITKNIHIPTIHYSEAMKLVCIGYKIVVCAISCDNKKLFSTKTKVLLVYDFLINQWSWKENNLTNNKYVICCIKVPVV